MSKHLRLVPSHEEEAEVGAQDTANGLETSNVIDLVQHKLANGNVASIAKAHAFGANEIGRLNRARIQRRIQLKAQEDEGYWAES